MRRTDREVTDITQIKSILTAGQVIHLGLSTGEYPYVVPTNYGFEFNDQNHLTLYIHGAPVGHKRELIANNSKVGFSIYVDGRVLVPKDPQHHTPSFQYRSVMGYGNAELVNDLKIKRHALQQITKHEVGHPWADLPDAAVAHVGIIKIEVLNYTAKANPRDPEKYL